MRQGGKMPKNVAWREGLFIRPQHFQQNNYMQHTEMMQRTLEIGANMWGLFNLDIDDQLLSMGKVSLVEASGILPDGTLFESKDFIKKLTLDISKEDGGKAVYLALPLNYENEDNTYYEEQEALPTRYVAKTHHDVPNTNAGEDSQADIIFAYPNFKLFKEGEVIDGYSAIQIAQIGSVTVNNAVTLDSTFSPTYLHLNQAKTIISKLNELQGMLRYRAEKMAEKVGGGSLQATELGDYLMLQLLNRTESRLHYYITQERLHPGELYLELVSLIGELAVFMKKEKRLAEQYTYVHMQQGLCFDEVFLELKKLLSRVLESSSTRIPLDKHKYGVHIAMLRDKSILADSSFILAVTANIDEAKLKKLLLDNLKIGTVEEIRNLVNHHLPGFKIVPLSAAPREIPYRVNQSYFRITMSAEDKQKLLRASGLALHYPETENLTIEFILWAIKNQ
jgi:type VI secretion system protein ImpJ